MSLKRTVSLVVMWLTPCLFAKDFTQLGQSNQLNIKVNPNSSQSNSHGPVVVVIPYILKAVALAGQLSVDT